MAVDNTNRKVAKKRRLVFLFFAIGIVLLTALFLLTTSRNQEVSLTPEEEIQNRETYTVSFPQSNAPRIKAWVSDTPIERSRGLAVTTTLSEDQGMLFIFDEPGVYPFWMKDMHFPIDILWLDENKEVVYIHSSAKPEDYPATYNPQTEARYVLEVVDGFVEDYGVKVGEELAW